MAPIDPNYIARFRQVMVHFTTRRAIMNVLQYGTLSNGKC
jgi:hypothetical protein